MTTLMLAFGLYIIGVAAVLYFRPQLMFRENSWKEFGLGSSGIRTVFPFWLFTFVWAIISYAAATVGNLYIAKLAMLSVPAHKQIENIAAPVSAIPQPTPAPGYYIVQPQPTGAPRFVYFGTSPPSFGDLAHA
jgi:hypothetical protein